MDTVVGPLVGFRVFGCLLGGSGTLRSTLGRRIGALLDRRLGPCECEAVYTPTAALADQSSLTTAAHAS